MKALDLVNLPFASANLIEASAGTGKTYTLTRLFLRALLQDTNNEKLPKPIELDNILLVTFTNAATEELRQRIRDTLRQARQAIDGSQRHDATINSILDHCENQTLAKLRLDYALQAIDQAQVMTIHGFCQRLLNEFALESGQLNESKLSFDQAYWISEAVLDFWRAKMVDLAPGELNLLLKNSVFKTPSALAKQLEELISQDEIQILPDESSSLSTRFKQYELACSNLKNQWQTGDLKHLMTDKLKKNRSQAKPSFWQNMDLFCAGPHLVPDFDNKGLGWEVWASSTMESVFTKAHADLAQHHFFNKAEQLAIESSTLIPEILAFWLRDALTYVQAWLTDHKNLSQTLSPDDLLSKTLALVSREDNKLITAKISQQYPIAFIDEFQDTDNIQWRIFQSLYENNNRAAVFYIGDPKQAIYGFRGADINTYYQAKSTIKPENYHCLDTNWRSSNALIDSINSLFNNNGETLRERFGFDYQSVKAGISDESLSLPHACECLLSSDSLSLINNRSEFLVLAAGLSATRIVQLLDQADADRNHIEPGDITILVRDRNEASIMKQVLKQNQINSVFLIRESVFHSAAASALVLVLLGLIEPQNPNALKAALASDFFQQPIDRLEEEFNSVAWLKHSERFAQYSDLWQRLGIMSACFQAIEDYRLMSTWLSQEDGERFATDIRHLLELLAGEASNLSLPQQVHCLRWWQQNESRQLEDSALRLETDDQLIKIETIHASKGLEYTAVFLPFVAWGRDKKDSIIKSQKNAERIFDFRSLGEPRNADPNNSDEELRLLYVALTRAKIYCNFTLLPTKCFEQTAIAKVLGQADNSSYETALNQLTKMTNIFINRITYRKNANQPTSPVGETSEQYLLRAKSFHRFLNNSRQTHSYTSLTQLNHGKNYQESSTLLAEDSAYPRASLDHVLTPFNFPAGTHTGILLHEIFENIPFRATSNDIANVCELALDSWHDPICKDASARDIVKQFLVIWVQDILSTPLSSSLTLSEIEEKNKNIEMEFSLPLYQLRPDTLCKILEAYGYSSPEVISSNQLSGLFRGFIDLVFEHQGKIYILDYKSNSLGPQHSDYYKDQLDKAMTHEQYHLQYLLYSAAIHRYCQKYVMNYRYETHFGGVYYLFLRGMSTKNGSDYGVFYHRPQGPCVDAIANLFGEA